MDKIEWTAKWKQKVGKNWLNGSRRARSGSRWWGSGKEGQQSQQIRVENSWSPNKEADKANKTKRDKKESKYRAKRYWRWESVEKE